MGYQIRSKNFGCRQSLGWHLEGQRQHPRDLSNRILDSSFQCLKLIENHSAVCYSTSQCQMIKLQAEIEEQKIKKHVPKPGPQH